jgi:Recombinase
MIIEILHNPAYAGAFVYGRRPIDPVLRKPGRRGSGVVRKPMEEWVTLQQGVYPAYISWEQFLRNQARLAENTQEAHVKQAAVEASAWSRTGRGSAAPRADLLWHVWTSDACGVQIAPALLV